MVFQNYALYPHMTVAANMGFALKIAGVPKDEIRRKVEEAAKILDLTEYLDRKPKALSGGQRQRVAMGRAIVREPQVFLMDEPLSNLDAKLRVSTRTQIASLQRRLGITTVYVTHDQVEALTMGDRVAVLKDGLLQQVDTPRNMYDRPANLFVAGFIGSPAMNLVEVPITDGGVKFGNSVVPVGRDALQAASAKGDKTVTVGVRPEHLDVVELNGELGAKTLAKDSAAGLPVVVNVVEELGSDAYVYGTAEIGGVTKDLVVRVGGRQVPEKGSTLHIVPRAGETHVFSTSTGERLSD
jgi:multiple sugar transport system ATP-binding protein